MTSEPDPSATDSRSAEGEWDDGPPPEPLALERVRRAASAAGVALQPDAEAFLALVVDEPYLDTRSVADNRAALDAALPLAAGGAELAEVRDLHVDGPAGAVPVRVYRPSLDPGLPGVVYAHGGGWVLCDLELHDATCRDLAAGSGAVVVSVDYRKAPEHPFPAAFDDCRAVTEALLAGAFGVDGSRVAVAGDSAGGNLAAALALDLRDRPSPTGHHLVHQVLIYPVVDARTGRTPSYARFADGFFLTARDMAYFVDSYARGADPRDPRLSPAAAADPAGLPPATVVLAEADPLVDEGRAYAERLRAAGVPVELRVYPGQVHPFVALGQIIGDAHDARRYIAGRLSESFTAPAPAR